jgi:dienelactone hydrolase
MKNSLRSAVLQRISPRVRRADRGARHRRRRAARAGQPTRGHAARQTLVVAAVVVLLAGAGYGVRRLTETRHEHHAARSARVVHPSGSPSATPTPQGQAGDFQVAQQSFTFNESAGGALGTRILPVLVFYPETGQSALASAASLAGAGEFPLVVFAPGFLQCGVVYNDLLTQWASAGYVVAVVNFPQTNCQTPNPNESDLINQPRDVATVIGSLDELSEHAKGPLSGLIDTSRVAVAGHSDGGDTVAAMAAMSCCRYPGLSAAIVLAGAEWPAFAGRWFGAPTPPMLFVQGSADTINPPAASTQLYQADTTGIRYYLDLYGAEHLPPYEGDQAPEPIVAQVTIDFLDQYLAGRGDESSALDSAGNVPGVAQLVSGGAQP